MFATVYFLKLFAFSLWAILPLLAFLSVIILGLGFVVGQLEKWTWLDRVYWSFITATTVGYGDRRPSAPLSKFFSIIIALAGIVTTGIIVSCAVFAASEVLKTQINAEQISEFKAIQKSHAAELKANHGFSHSNICEQDQ